MSASEWDRITTELEEAKAENQRLKEIVVRCNSDWSRLRDFIKGGNGPGEMFRFMDAAKKNDGKGVGMFQSYIASLWAEVERLQKQLQ